MLSVKEAASIILNDFGMARSISELITIIQYIMPRRHSIGTVVASTNPQCISMETLPYCQIKFHMPADTQPIYM